MPELPNAPALSVQIPTRGRAGQLARCVGALAQVSRDLSPGEVEVLIGLDGADETAGRSAREAWQGARPDAAQALRVVEFPRQGHLPIRRGLVGMTKAPIVVFMNDDVVAQPGFLSAHFAAHREAEATGRYPHGVMVVGQTPWAVPEGDTLFDRLVRETSLIFFYDQMDAAQGDRWRDWGFRHFWTLNASAPQRAVLAAGGVTAIHDTYGHEDIELAFRLGRQFGMPVLYRPGARGIHEHRYSPADVMRREMSLGAASWRFARVSPEFGLALFGRDVTGEAEAAYSLEFVERERQAAERLAADFESLSRMSAMCVPSELLQALSRQFLLLKRHLWRRGLLEAASRDQRPPSVGERVFVF